MYKLHFIYKILETIIPTYFPQKEQCARRDVNFDAHPIATSPVVSQHTPRATSRTRKKRRLRWRGRLRGWKPTSVARRVPTRALLRVPSRAARNSIETMTFCWDHLLHISWKRCHETINSTGTSYPGSLFRPFKPAGFLRRDPSDLINYFAQQPGTLYN